MISSKDVVNAAMKVGVTNGQLSLSQFKQFFVVIRDSIDLSKAANMRLTPGIDPGESPAQQEDVLNDMFQKFKVKKEDITIPVGELLKWDELEYLKRAKAISPRAVEEILRRMSLTIYHDISYEQFKDFMRALDECVDTSRIPSESQIKNDDFTEKNKGKATSKKSGSSEEKTKNQGLSNPKNSHDKKASPVNVNNQPKTAPGSSNGRNMKSSVIDDMEMEKEDGYDNEEDEEFDENYLDENLDALVDGFSDPELNEMVGFF